jgi:hypothetical protein
MQARSGFLPRLKIPDLVDTDESIAEPKASDGSSPKYSLKRCISNSVTGTSL